jgi:hypothetical protein
MQIRKDLQSWPGFNYVNWQNAAPFCTDNKVNLEEAWVWADKGDQGTNSRNRTGIRGLSTL